jgi:WASH complex subunit 4, N-terminal
MYVCFFFLVRYSLPFSPILQSIEAIYHRRSVLIGETVGLMMQQLSFALQSALLPLRVGLQSNKQYSDAKLDTLASIHLSLQMLNGPSTSARQVLLDLCLHRVLALSTIKDNTLTQIRYHKKQLEILSRLQGVCVCVCVCVYVYVCECM